MQMEAVFGFIFDEDIAYLKQQAFLFLTSSGKLIKSLLFD